MKDGASITAWSPRIRVPPNQSTMAIIAEPRNSLTGWALAWRTATWLFLRRMDSVTCPKRLSIRRSARKAFTMRSPPRVSSTWLIVSLQYFCASAESAFRRRPVALMTRIISGAKTITNRVSCQDIRKSTNR